MGKKKSNKTKIRHIEENKIRHIKAEIKKSKNKLDKLLKRGDEGKSGGIIRDSTKHIALLDYIKSLESKLK